MNPKENIGTAIESMRALYKRKGYVFIEDGVYIPNIMGVRSTNINSNEFNDIGVCAYKDIYKNWCIDYFNMTTDPGVYYRKNTLNVAGTGILAPQQIIDGFKLGLHRGKKALVQNKPFLVYRDNNKDDKLDLDNIVWAGVECGFNFHGAIDSRIIISKNVGKFSAGCQVVQFSSKFQLILDVCNLAKKYNVISAFNYVLVEENEFNDIQY